jgi:hypothetical protein
MRITAVILNGKSEARKTGKLEIEKENKKDRGREMIDMDAF